jgi:hypothetical protein
MYRKNEDEMKKGKDPSNYFVLTIASLFIFAFLLIGVCILIYYKDAAKCQSYGGTYKVIENHGKYKIYGCVK